MFAYTVLTHVILYTGHFSCIPSNILTWDDGLTTDSDIIRYTIFAVAIFSETAF